MLKRAVLLHREAQRRRQVSGHCAPALHCLMTLHMQFRMHSRPSDQVLYIFSCLYSCRLLLIANHICKLAATRSQGCSLSFLAESSVISAAGPARSTFLWRPNPVASDLTSSSDSAASVERLPVAEVLPAVEVLPAISPLAAPQPAAGVFPAAVHPGQQLSDIATPAALLADAGAVVERPVIQPEGEAPEYFADAAPWWLRRHQQDDRPRQQQPAVPAEQARQSSARQWQPTAQLAPDQQNPIQAAKPRAAVGQLEALAASADSSTDLDLYGRTEPAAQQPDTPQDGPLRAAAGAAAIADMQPTGSPAIDAMTPASIVTVSAAASAQAQESRQQVAADSAEHSAAAAAAATKGAVGSDVSSGSRVESAQVQPAGVFEEVRLSQNALSQNALSQKAKQTTATNMCLPP